jgi:hypothetical protein
MLILATVAYRAGTSPAITLLDGDWRLFIVILALLLAISFNSLLIFRHQQWLS